MKNFLLDTNIIIYALNGDPHTTTLLAGFSEIKLHISIISWIETLTGSFRHGQALDEILRQLEYFHRLPLGDFIARTGAMIMQEKLKRGHKKQFQDSLIAATAVMYNMTLVTNNPRDFRGIKGLKIIAPKK